MHTEACIPAIPCTVVQHLGKPVASCHVLKAFCLALHSTGAHNSLLKGLQKYAFCAGGLGFFS